MPDLMIGTEVIREMLCRGAATANTVTGLVKQTALALDHGEWLDEPNHEIWKHALEIYITMKGEKDGRG